MNKKPNLIVLLGPTAVGKTALSLALAEHWQGEIINGDSMQVYKGLDIGTAKLPFLERRGIAHHLMDIIPASGSYSAAQFQQDAHALIGDITSRGKLPIIVGGTGLYIESLVYEFPFAETSSDPDTRNRLTQEAASNEFILWKKLNEIDPITANRIHQNDKRRIIRALEYWEVTGQPLSKMREQTTRNSPYDFTLIGLTMDRPLLYARIESRVDEMISMGLVNEVQGLLTKMADDQWPAMQAIGYKEMIAHLRGELTMEEAIEQLKRNTRRFAKRQWSWFRHMTDIRWVDVSKIGRFNEHLQQIHGIVSENRSFIEAGGSH